MATVSDGVIKKIIKHVLFKEDYRIEIVTLINSRFLDFAITFFKEIISAKLRNEAITIDWYKKEFLNDSLPSDELIINSGLNRKTISNMYNSACREVVLTATKEHYALLYEAISNLVQENNEIDIMLTLKYQGVSVDLNINESLIVINVLAVKRAQLRGGSWSSAGKRTEKLLMLTLCQLFQVPRTNYELTGLTMENREVDFYFISRNKTRYQCEVKLMGKGNPESADGTYNARDSHIFVGDFLSDLVKMQLDSNNIKWVELRRNEGFRKMSSILKELDIPYVDFTEELTEAKVFDIVSSLMEKIPEVEEDEFDFSLDG
ncbi:MAG: CfrBI family restriction endonuclease [Anaerolineaceae bacterium]|jgi:hypothetical protein|nr:CfrBI family restriction endonuclease [Anaerolineaceae bacterium]